jgi:hypothetical protein
MSCPSVVTGIAYRSGIIQCSHFASLIASAQTYEITGLVDFSQKPWKTATGVGVGTLHRGLAPCFLLMETTEYKTMALPSNISSLSCSEY